jgi:putative DNA primase/helicase
MSSHNGTGGTAAPAAAEPRPVVIYQSGWTDRIDRELTRLDRWAAWRYEFRRGKGGAGKWTKVPYRAGPGCGGEGGRPKALSNKPETWATFRAALAAYGANADRADGGRLDGIGFMFHPDDGLVGVDFDRCLGGDGELADWASGWLLRLGPSYAEVSPSGRGIKAIYRGRLPARADGKTGRKRGGYGLDGAGAIELYSEGRFFTITGDLRS